MTNLAGNGFIIAQNDDDDDDDDEIIFLKMKTVFFVCLQGKLINRFQQHIASTIGYSTCFMRIR